MNVVNQVIQTNDYNRFSLLNGNRNVNKLHVERLKSSFQKNYLLSPIVVNENFEIIDGQHRFNAAKALGLPVNYIVAKGYGLIEVQLLNTNMKNWSKAEYLKSYCDLGFSEYIKMKKFMDHFPDFGIAVSEQLLTNTYGGVNNRGIAAKIDGKNKGRIKNFQEGNFKIADLPLAYENGEKIMMIKPYYDGFANPVFVAAMIGIFKNKNYNHSQLLQKLRQNPNSLVHCKKSTQYKILIEDIYNYRSREKVSLRF